MALKTFTSLEYYIYLSVETSGYDLKIPDTNVTAKRSTGFELAVLLIAVRWAMSSLVSRDITQRLKSFHFHLL